MKTLKWLNENLEKTICVFLLSAMTLILFIQVIMRYGFNNSLTWSEELARYIFIWLIYFGISCGSAERKHLKVEAFLHLFPKRLRPYVEILADLLFLSFAVFIVVTSYDLVLKQMVMKQKSPALGIPMAVIYAAPMVGFFLTSIRQIQAVAYRWKVARGMITEEGENDEC